MTPEGWEKVAEAFEAARNCAESARPAVIRRICGDDEELIAQAAALLTSAAQGFLSHPVFESRMPAMPMVPPRFEPGAVLAGRFAIVRLVGCGGMGEVYAAEDRELGTVVALKTLRPGLAADPRALGRFKREILTARRISHPNVCRLHDFAVHPGVEPVPFLTMELLHGETLADYLRRAGRAPDSDARRWLAQIAAGLDAAHGAGVVHRDLKPGNILLCADAAPPRAVITDFGLAIWAAGAAAGDAAPTRLIGTLAYMAPEQLAGEEPTAASDIYAFGLVGYELVTGQAAYAGRGPLAGVLQRWQGSYTPPSELVPELGSGWDRLIAACLREPPALRPARATAALELLPPAPLKPSSPRLRHRIKLALCATAALAATALGAAVFRYYQVRPRVTAGSEILVTPVINATDDPRLAAATSALDQDLAQSAQFVVTTPAQVADELQRMEQPPALRAALARQPALARQVAMRRGAPLVLFSTISELAGQYRIDFELERVGHDPDAPSRRWSTAQVAGSSTEIFDALHAGADWVRSLAGEQPAALASTDQPPQDITTPSWEALSYYDRAENEIAAGRSAAAVPLFQQAVAADPGFALAWSRLGDVLISQRQTRDGYADYRRALDAQAGRRLSSRERLRLQGIIASDTGAYAAAVQAFQAYTALYPRDATGWFYQGLPDMEMAQPARALAAWAQAARLHPASAAILGNEAQFDLWLGRVTDAQTAFARIPAGNDDITAYLGSLIGFVRGDPNQVVTSIQRLRSSADSFWRGRAALVEADYWAEQGQTDKAALLLQADLRADAGTGSSANLSEEHLALCELEAPDHTAAALADCRAAVALEPSLPVMVRAATVLARHGRAQEAEALLPRLQSSTPAGPELRSAVERIRGEVLLARGQGAAAMAAFRAARQAGGALDDTEFLAHGLAMTGDRAAALALYERWAANPGLVWYLPDYFPPGHYRQMLAQAAALAAGMHRPEATALDRRLATLAGC